MAQGLATYLFFEFSVLGVKSGGGEAWTNMKGETIKVAGTCGPGWGTACLFGS